MALMWFLLDFVLAIFVRFYRLCLITCDWSIYWLIWFVSYIISLGKAKKLSNVIFGTVLCDHHHHHLASNSFDFCSFLEIFLCVVCCRSRFTSFSRFTYSFSYSISEIRRCFCVSFLTNLYFLLFETIMFVWCQVVHGISELIIQYIFFLLACCLSVLFMNRVCITCVRCQCVGLFFAELPILY